MATTVATFVIGIRHHHPIIGLPTWQPFMSQQPIFHLYDYTFESFSGSISSISSSSSNTLTTTTTTPFPNLVVSPGASALSLHRSGLALDPFTGPPFSPASSLSTMTPFSSTTSSLTTKLQSIRSGHSSGGGSDRNLASMAVGPAALLGGSAVIYKIAMASPSAGLSPIATTYMLLLAFQYGLQPRVSRRYIRPETNKKSVALVEELVKTLISAVIFLGSGEARKAKALQGWSLSSSALVAGLPAALYAIQGVCQYIAYQNLDPVSFNGLTQTKMLSAALFCFLLMGKKQSFLQIVALGLLSLSALIFQGTLSLPSFLANVSPKSVPSSTSTPLAKDAAKSEKKNDDTGVTVDKKYRFSHGVMPCLAATLLSGLAGALSQKGLQLYGGNGRDAYLYTIEVSFFSAICLLISMTFGNKSNSNKSATQTSVKTSSGYFDYWSWSTLIPIVLKALGGLLTALVHKHAGSVLKGFALILGLVLSGVIQTILDDEQLSLEQIVGTFLVMLSSWLHFTHPPLP